MDGIGKKALEKKRDQLIVLFKCKGANSPAPQFFLCFGWGCGYVTV